MSLHKIPFYLAVVLCLVTVFGLFTVKDNVMTLKTELQEVKKQVQNEEDAIHILKAELAYLGSPERIQKLAEKHLNLEKPKVTQMTNDPLVNEAEQTRTVASKSVRKTAKWRYKKGPSKYLTMTKGE
jgi:cell division protein FtsL